MNHEAAIRALHTAEAIDALELYVVVDDQRRPKFGCRLWDGLTSMSSEDAEGFARQFNAITATMRGVWAGQFEDRARSAIAKAESAT
jgi:hypothetical protein